MPFPRKHFAARPPRTGGMNGTEAAYFAELELRKRAGEIAWLGTHGQVTLKIGPDCRYTPDFPYIDKAGAFHFVEIKGFMREDALVKFKVAAEKFPWAHWRMVRRKKGAWETLYEF